MVLALLLPASVGFMAAGPLTTSTLATRWFHKRRGLALGMAAVATSGGGLVVVPLLSHAIQTYGWRQGLLFEALAIGAIIIALAVLVLRDSPASMGLEGHAENQGRVMQGLAHRPDWRAILGRRAFWIPSLALANISGTCQAIVVTIVPYGVQLGASMTQAAFFISAFAMSAAAAKVLAGFLADRMDQLWLIAAAILLMVLAQLLLCLVPSHQVLLVSSCLAGASLGFALPTTAGLIAAAFGAQFFGAAMGWTYALILIFSIIATRFIGFVYDQAHGYIPAFATFLGISSFTLVFTLLVGAKTRTPAYG
jgi:MFS family permease